MKEYLVTIAHQKFGNGYEAHITKKAINKRVAINKAIKEVEQDKKFVPRDTVGSTMKLWIERLS